MSSLDRTHAIVARDEKRMTPFIHRKRPTGRTCLSGSLGIATVFLVSSWGCHLLSAAAARRAGWLRGPLLKLRVHLISELLEYRWAVSRVVGKDRKKWREQVTNRQQP